MPIDEQTLKNIFSGPGTGERIHGISQSTSPVGGQLSSIDGSKNDVNLGWADATGNLENARAMQQSMWHNTAEFPFRFLYGTGAKTAQMLASTFDLGQGMLNMSNNIGDETRTALERGLNNALTSELSSYLKQAEEVGMKPHQIYLSDEYKAMSPLRQIFTSEWLATTGADMAGFTVASLAPAMGLQKLVAAGLTGIAASEAIWGSQLLKSKSLVDKISSAVGGTLAASGEAVVESGQTYQTGLDSGLTPAEALERAKGSYLANVAVLSLSNMWELTMLTKGLNTSRKLARSSLSAGADGTMSAIKPTASTYLKSIGKNAGTGVLVEGFWEENIQLAIQKHQEDIINNHNLPLKESYGNLLGHYLENFGSSEGWENILGGAVMGLITGGFGGATKVADKYEITKKSVDDFNQGYITGYKKDAQGNYEYEQNADGTPKLVNGEKVKIPERHKFSMPEYTKAVDELSKSQDNRNRMLSLLKNLGVQFEGSALQDHLAALNLDELYHYTGNQLLANMAHYYISHGMTDQLLTRLEVVKKSSDEDKVMFSRGLKENVTLDEHMNNYKAKVLEYEKAFNKLDDSYGWQTKNVVVKTPDGNTKTVVAPLYDIHGLYMSTIGAKQANEGITSLKLKNTQLELKLLTSFQEDEFYTGKGNFDMEKAVKKAAAEKGDENHIDAREYVKNQYEIKALQESAIEHKKTLSELLDTKKAQERLNKAVKASNTFIEQAVEQFNSGKTQDLSPFQQKIYEYKRKRESGAGRLFDSNNKPGELKTLADGKTYFVHDDDNLADFIVDETNIDDVLSGFKTKDQIKKEFQDSKQEIIIKARIDALEKLIEQTYKEQERVKTRLTKADAATAEFQAKLDQLYKDLQDSDKRTKASKKIKDSILTATQRLERYNQAKNQLISQKTSIEEKLEFLFKELQSNESRDPNTEKTELDAQFNALAAQTVDSAQTLISLSSMLIDELSVKTETLEETIKQLEKIIAEHEDLKKFIVFYNKNKVHELEVKYTIPIIRRFITENQDIIPNQLLTGLFTNIQDPKKLINDLNALQEQYNKVHVINSDLYFLNNNLSLSKERLEAVKDQIKTLKELTAEYEADIDFLQRYEMFNKIYGEFQVKFIADFKPYLDKANQVFADLIAPVPAETAESTEFAQMDAEEEKRFTSLFTGLSARKHSIFTTSGNTNDGEKGRILGLVMQQLTNVENKYKLRVINSEDPEIRKSFYTEEELRYEAEERLKNPDYFPLKVVLVDKTTGASIKRNEEGTINKGNIPVTFYLHVDAFVNNLDPAAAAVEYFNRVVGTNKYSKEYFEAFYNKEHPKHKIVNPNNKPTLNLNTGKYFTSLEEIENYVKEQLKQQLVTFRQTIFNEIKAGKVVHLPIIGKSRGVPVISESKTIQKALGPATSIAPNGIMIVSGEAGERLVHKSFAGLNFVAKNGSVVVVMNDLIHFDSNVRTSLTTEQDAQLIIDLLAHAYGPNNPEQTIRDTEGKLHYIRNKKAAKSGAPSLIDQLIVWGGMKGRYKQYQIFLDPTTGHIKYGLNPQTKKPYYIRLAELADPEKNKEFKAFLQTKYFNASNKLLLQTKNSVYLQPLKLEKVTDAEGVVTTVLKMQEWKPLNENHSGYVHFLTKLEKLQTTLPEKGQVQAHNMYLVYDEKHPEITDKPIKEEKKAEDKKTTSPVSDKKVETAPAVHTGETFDWLIRSDEELPSNGSIVFTKTGRDGGILVYKGNLKDGVWRFSEATKNGEAFTPGNTPEELDINFNDIIEKYKGDEGIAPIGITSMMVSPNEYSNQTEVRQSVQPNVQVKKADIERRRKELKLEIEELDKTVGVLQSRIIKFQNKDPKINKQWEEGKLKLKELNAELTALETKPTEDNSPVKSLDAVLDQVKAAILTNEQILEVAKKILVGQEVSNPEWKAAWNYYEELKNRPKPLRASTVKDPNDIDESIKEVMKKCSPF